MILADVLEGTAAGVYRTTLDGVREGVASGSQLAEEVRGFGSDSRTTPAGGVFIALKGERADGHDFVGDVFAAGALGALVSDSWLRKVKSDLRFPPNRLLLTTPEPLSALQALASHWRSKHDVTVVGVTGSIGKTTVKELTARAISSLGPETILKSTGNLNSEVGLPLELLRLTAEHRFAVLEMGMYQRGEIALLASLSRPSVGVVTCVQANHLERTGSMQATAQAKAELVHALPAGGLAVLNADDRLVRLMAPASRAAVAFYGSVPGVDIRLESTESAGRDGFTATIRHGASRLRIQTTLPGAHNAKNFLPAMLVAHHLGVAWQDIADSLRDPAVPGRLQYVPGPDGSTVLDDRYNASAPSVLAALDLLKAETGRRMALLGEMYELGSSEEEQHRMVGRRAGDLDYLILLGPRTRWIREEAERAGLAAEKIVMVQDNEQAVEAAREVLAPGDTLLIKGSRGLRLEDVVEALTGAVGERH